MPTAFGGHGRGTASSRFTREAGGASTSSQGSGGATPNSPPSSTSPSLPGGSNMMWSGALSQRSNGSGVRNSIASTNSFDATKAKSGGAPGLFSLVGLAQPTLEVHLAEDLLFLHPAAPDEISDDPVVQGTVTLYLSKKRNLTHLAVKLIGRQDISWGDSSPYESSITLDKEVQLLAKGQELVLEKGYHKFEFEFLVPSSTPPSERSVFGRVRYTIVAKSKGLGQLNGDISSHEKLLFLATNASTNPTLSPGGAGPSRPPPPLDHRHEGLVDDLGLYTMACQSTYSMVSGLVLLRFELVAPPSHVVLYAIKVKINQYFHLISPSDPNKRSSPPVDVKTVMHLDGTRPPNFGKVDEAVLASYAAARNDPTKASSPLKVLQPGEGYKIHHLARFPNDTVLRPSTPTWSNASIRVRHVVALELTYRVLSPEEIRDGQLVNKVKERDDKGKEKIKDRKKLVVSRPFEIFSCMCFVDSLSLPAYTRVDPNLSPTGPLPRVTSSDGLLQRFDVGTDEPEKPPPCVCGYQFRQVIKFHGADLLREPGEEGLTYPIVKDSDSPVTSPSATYRETRSNPFFRREASYKDRLGLGSMSPTSPSLGAASSSPSISPPVQDASRSNSA
ncbi:BZ3500_MvSof-1268-A1-R1_Chr3-1g05476 [Microbotryum saponariae]|uniref:BZ3500_MvSof-1268-A1-R1_Chr3-1g05476 protein n=1 Tax=Microbotryum saponariae TaxID=289078 RepID=A0A2X0KWF3_9BASI|nr:BZ3500_MvSof-1268-A1-R1_Chr3-1g05476 [Microbotryum saponariae]SDA04667.1 BZ3501_MvSof-1269-A2-R1_Chr3-1g05147 [Microbotryum saponariae]